jgi:hypothetical protein
MLRNFYQYIVGSVNVLNERIGFKGPRVMGGMTLTFGGKRDNFNLLCEIWGKGGFDGYRKKIEGARNLFASAAQASGELCARS